MEPYELRSKKIRKGKCLHCGKEFLQKYHDKIYCSERCKKNAAIKRYWKRHPKEAKIKFNRMRRKREALQRKLVLEYYGGKPSRCKNCGYRIYECLDIDHVNGDGKGNIHRKKIRGTIYHWIIKNKFPKGFQVLCRNCNWLKYIRSKNTC